MHSLNNVTTVVEDSPDVFGIDGTGKVWITVVLSVTTGCAYSLHTKTQTIRFDMTKLHKHKSYQKFVPYKVFSPNKLRRFSRIENSLKERNIIMK